MARKRKRVKKAGKIDLLRADVSVLYSEIRGLRTDVNTMAGLRGQIEAMADKVRVMEKLVRGALCQAEDV